MKKLCCAMSLMFLMCASGNATRYGADIATSAASKANASSLYESGNPLNDKDCCFKPELAENASIFDCSGLVSWAAGLRRRYYTGDLVSKFLVQISFEQLQPGDFLYTPGKPGTDFPERHIIIYEGSDNGYIQVIHAAGEENGVKRAGGPNWTPARLQSWGFTPYRLKTDAEAPSVSISGVENNHAYFTEKTVSFSASDNLDTRPCGRMWVNGEKILEHCSQGNKTFKETGTYTVKVEAVDWAGNVSAPKEVTFSIVNKANPTVSATNMGGGGEWATERCVVTNWGQRVANGTFMPGISDYPMSNNPSKSLSVSFYSDYAPSVSAQLTYMSGHVASPDF